MGRWLVGLLAAVLVLVLGSPLRLLEVVVVQQLLLPELQSQLEELRSLQGERRWLLVVEQQWLLLTEEGSARTRGAES